MAARYELPGKVGSYLLMFIETNARLLADAASSFPAGAIKLHHSCFLPHLPSLNRAAKSKHLELHVGVTAL